MKLRKIISAFLVCAMVFGMMSIVAFADEGETSGQAESDIVEISNAEQLKEFSEKSQTSGFKGKTVVLTDDIDMKDVTDWEPIGSKAKFSGTFDGQNHTISNFKSISNGFHKGGYCNGFFGVLGGATIKNITFDNADVECAYTYNYGNIFGIVAAYSYGDKFENITVKNSKVRGFGKVGGILGMAAEPTAKTIVTDCAVYDTEINGTYDAGAIIGLGQGTIVMTGNKIKNVTYNQDPSYNYVFLDTEVACDGSAKTCAGNGTQVHGKYWVYDGYKWGGYSDFYTQYGDSKHDCVLKNGDKLANSEIVHDAVAEIDGVKYLTIADAVNDAKEGDVIKVLYDAKGNGTQIPSGKNLTIDFDGHTYTLDNPLVGSENTKTNGFQLLKDSYIVFKNGSLYSEEANILIQNYANLTLQDMNLSLNRVYEKPGQPLYTLSNNNGKVVLTGNTNISALDVNYAFDVCRFSSYPGVSVTLDKNMTGTIDGNIELTGEKLNDNFELVIENGNFNGKIVNSAPTADIRISGGNFATDVKEYVVDGYTTKLVDGRYYVVEAEAKVIDTAKTTGVEVKLDALEKHDSIDLNDDATYKVVVTTAPAEDIKAANDKINAAGDTNSEKHTFDISVIKTDSEGSKKDISGTITDQQVTLTLSEKPEGDVHVYHVNGEGAVEEITPVTVNGNEVTFIAPSFSTYTVTYNTGAVDESTITNKVGVVFSPVADGSNEYYITLKALEDGKKINRFMSADLAFKNNGTDVSYDITPAANINVNEIAENEYRFEMNGSSASSVSGEAITIGTVTFGGTGTVDFGIDEAYTSEHSVNIVNTAKSSDNIIDHYDAASATLIVNDAANKTDYPTIADDESGKINTVLKAETAELTVNVKFNNPVGNQIAEYQDMKVTVSGGDLAAEKTFAIGSDENAVENGMATVLCDELTKNIAYTVTVSGAGYRTARHTVTMNSDKTLTFWNNVLDNAASVEEGKTAVTKNFLAGDIVKDNKINIYDLSAVVSYYGRTNDTSAEDAYAKYDLNRDGVIDSKDVAMVLVSWGN